MDLGLKNKVAVLTGGGAIGGIGWATVKELVAEGVQVVMGDIRVESGYSELSRYGYVVTQEIDLSLAGNPDKLVETALGAFGRLDFLINNLGISPIRTGFLDTKDEDWDRTHSINFMSNVRATRAALPHLIKNKGAIVNLASTLGSAPIPTMVDYCAFKSATLNLTKSLSEEFGPKGVRVVAISPGPVLTPQWSRPGGQLENMAKAMNTDSKTMRTKLLPDILKLVVGRMVESEEIAAAIVFALSGRMGAMTGSQIVVDAGCLKTI